ncbi:MAG: AmmeMemoRadiSam system protein B [Candidatus Izemoplasmatales bacterium]
MSLLGTFIVPHPPLIIPEVGRGEEEKIKDTIDAYKKIAKEISHLKPETIIVLSPHSTNYQDYFHISPGEQAKGDFRNFGANVSVEVEYDQAFIEDIETLAQKENFPTGTKGERDNRLDHATMIPLYFINEFYKDYQVIRIGLSGLSLKKHWAFGKLIKKACESRDKNYVIVASGDLSHKLKEEGPYGYAKEGPVFDESVTKAIKDNDLKQLMDYKDNFIDKAAECGLRSFVIMAGAIEDEDFSSNLLSYEGPFGVGYAVASFLPK